MKRIVLTLAIVVGLFSTNQVFSQWDFGGRVGAAWFLGDISGTGTEKQIGPMATQFSQVGMTIGGAARYWISPAWAVQGELNWTRVKGSDHLSERPTQYSRNLSFRTDIIEMSALAQWHFLRLEDVGRTYRYKLSFSPFIAAGLSGFYYNPKAEYQGSYVALRPLKTEGVDYGPVSFAIPFGGGFEFKLDKKHIFGFEAMGRRAFTDYIDDVSTDYQHYSKFDDATALALQDRSVEISPTDPLYTSPVYYSYGSNEDQAGKRGNSEFKDWFWHTAVYYKYALKNKKRKFNRRKYHFARRKVKRKRSRAKF